MTVRCYLDSLGYFQFGHILKLINKTGLFKLLLYYISIASFLIFMFQSDDVLHATFKFGKVLNMK